jgi:hypothetical protein
MLTDIFSNRYSTVPLFVAFEEPYRRLLVQCFKMLESQVKPYYVSGEVDQSAKKYWTNIHDRMAMELGLKSLSPLTYSYQTNHMGVSHTQAGVWAIVTVCETWMVSQPKTPRDVDQHVKDRISFVELAFRIRSEEIAASNDKTEINLLAVLAQGPKEKFGTKAWYQAQTDKVATEFSGHIEELNARFLQASCGLHYHNGFIQLAKDELTTRITEEPFWHLVSHPQWKNVDIDMKQAVDSRDTGGRDPAFYAARSLESTIKIISAQRGWTTGRENGAHNFIDHLGANKNQFITGWEAEALKLIFTKVRNPLGHGPGSEPMPSLSNQATDWAIESCMSWIKSLIRRL